MCIILFSCLLAKSNHTDKLFDTLCRKHNIRRRSHKGHGLIGIECRRLLDNHRELCDAAFKRSDLVAAAPSYTVLDANPRHIKIRLKLNLSTSSTTSSVEFNYNKSYNDTLRWCQLTKVLSRLIMKQDELSEKQQTTLHNTIVAYQNFRILSPLLQHQNRVRPITIKEHILITHIIQFLAISKKKCIGDKSEQALEANHQVTKLYDSRHRNCINETQASRIIESANKNKFAKHPPPTE
jgi:hypothetical protein